MTAQEFGDLIRLGRKALGMTQRDLALVINSGERFVIELEAGKGTSQLAKALAAAQAVGVRIATPDRFGADSDMPDGAEVSVEDL